MTFLLAAVTTLATACSRHDDRVPPEVGTRPALAVYYTGELRGRYDGTGGASTRGGLARRATLVDRGRVEAEAVLQLDAGNLLPAANDDLPAASPEFLGALAHRLFVAYRRLGVDVVVPGERELALGAEALGRLATESKVPMVAANVLGAGGRQAFPSDRLIDAAGHKVGVFGIVDLSGESAASLPRWGFSLGNGGQAARAASASLRGRGADLVVAVVHADRGVERARAILGAAGLWGSPGGVDLLVVGRQPPPRDVPVPSPARRISAPAALEADPWGTSLGRVDIRWPKSGGAPRLDDCTAAVTSAVPEQWGVALIERAATTPIVDDGRLANTPARPGEAPPEPQSFEKWDFGSTSACAGCHQLEDAQWKTTDHAQALETLRSHGHGRDPACLGCHLTGFLANGGTRNLKTATTFFADVGCESCHGPSVQHVRSVDKRLGTSRHVDAGVCLGCHTPDQNIGPFDVVAAMKEILGPGHGMPVPQ